MLHSDRVYFPQFEFYSLVAALSTHTLCIQLARKEGSQTAVQFGSTRSLESNKAVTLHGHINTS